MVEVFYANLDTCESWNEQEYSLQGERGTATPGWYWSTDRSKSGGVGPFATAADAAADTHTENGRMMIALAGEMEKFGNLTEDNMEDLYLTAVEVGLVDDDD